LEKSLESPQRQGLRPRTLLASGGWGLRPQTLTLLLLSADVDLLVCDSSVKRILLLRKITEFITQQLFCYCFLYALLRIFFTENSTVFVGRGAKIVLPPGAGYPRYAIAHMTTLWRFEHLSSLKRHMIFECSLMPACKVSFVYEVFVFARVARAAVIRESLK